MEPGRPGRRLYADQPSFSSTLLDAIYKSMDEPGDGAAEASKKREEEALHYSQCYYKASLAGSYRASSRPHAAAATTSSSSDCSSYGGFSSSEAESSQHRRLRPVRTTGGGAAAAPAVPEKKPRPGAAIRAKLRDLRGKPASPGARLAGFLNLIFAGGKHHRGGPASTAAAESACSTASSSYSRSCLSKTPSTRGQPKRTVRFLDSDVDATPASAERRGRVQVGHLEQMLLRRMEMESDGDDDDEEEDSSDASSDLFELESLAYRDELPVYETTRVVLNRGGIGHGHGYAAAAHGRSTRVV